ncbi:mycothiol maleylpyruvate isomerase-like protein [Kineococcus xinjiangensis]|uniref:Mycothiol maleylpyruvate isomerase-like protein n=1 Tax=Kineococcus xinjiangensis TaxID=512762 RepID=A0A2S6IGD8_9ACTN|nr:mycothiol maleylpyruvate isomerase-like protein [Kineococcus xinjiangensis]
MPVCDVQALQEATEAVAAVLHDVREADWSRGAGDVSWSCRDVVVHITDCLISYAAQLATGAENDFVPLTAGIDQGADNAAAVRALQAAAALLAATVRTAPDGAAGWHPCGMADAEATAAMGVVELLVHTHDVCSGLGVDWRGPAGPPTAALRRIFPDVTDVLEDHEPWEALLWATGRAELADRARRTDWQWHNQRPVD